MALTALDAAREESYGRVEAIAGDPSFLWQLATLKRSYRQTPAS